MMILWYFVYDDSRRLCCMLRFSLKHSSLGGTILGVLWDLRESRPEGVGYRAYGGHEQLPVGVWMRLVMIGSPMPVCEINWQINWHLSDFRKPLNLNRLKLVSISQSSKVLLLCKVLHVKDVLDELTRWEADISMACASPRRWFAMHRGKTRAGRHQPSLSLAC